MPNPLLLILAGAVVVLALLAWIVSTIRADGRTQAGKLARVDDHEGWADGHLEELTQLRVAVHDDAAPLTGHEDVDAGVPVDVYASVREHLADHPADDEPVWPPASLATPAQTQTRPPVGRAKVYNDAAPGGYRARHGEPADEAPMAPVGDPDPDRPTAAGINLWFARHVAESCGALR